MIMIKMLLFSEQALNHFNHYHCRLFLDFRIYISPQTSSSVCCRHCCHCRQDRHYRQAADYPGDHTGSPLHFAALNTLRLQHHTYVCVCISRLRQIRVGEMVIVSYIAVYGVDVIITYMASVNIERLTIILPINIYI